MFHAFNISANTQRNGIPQKGDRDMARLNKVTLLAAFVSLMGTSAFANSTALATTEKEVAIQKVFVPPSGYDDNDTIEMVLDGVIPNSCWRLARNEFSIDQANHWIFVKQYIYKLNSEACADEASLSDAQKLPVPFTTELKVGMLKSGQYTIRYWQGASAFGDRIFYVEHAPVETVDSLPYALVSSVNIADQINESSSVVTTLQGSLTSTCMELDNQVTQHVFDDVRVILPTVHILPGICLYVLQPFETDVNLGAMTQGRYMLHIRSLNGEALNRVFSVVKPTP